MSERTFAALREGEYGQALLLMQEDAGADAQEQVLVQAARGATWIYLGQWQRAEEQLSRAFEASAQLDRGAKMTRAAVIGYLGLLALLRGKPHEAREQFAAAQVLERAAKVRFQWLNFTWGLGEALMGWGPPEYERAARQLANARRQAVAAENKADELEIATAQADLQLRQKEFSLALAIMEEADDKLPPIEFHERAPAIYRRRARIWRALQEDEKAEDDELQAREIVENRARLIIDEALRQAYLAAQAG